jgi:hypothetical protein
VAGKPGTAQFAYVRLREVLILTAQCHGHLDVADTRRASQRSTHGKDQFVKGPRHACPTVEEPTHLGVLPQPEQLDEAIRDKHEIAPLAPIRVRHIRGPKQGDLAGPDELLIRVPDHTRHRAFVGLTWPIVIRTLATSRVTVTRLDLNDDCQGATVVRIRQRDVAELDHGLS